MAHPLVSVVMPCFNSERHLCEAIESILSQTFRNIEFLILNDGSEDRTRDICLSYSSIDQRIRFVDFSENRGLVCAANTLLTLARGRYIARMDSDDISLPNRIERQVRYMELNHERIACGSAVEQFDSNGTIMVSRKSNNNDALLFISLRNCPIWHSSSMIRRSAIETYGLRYDQDFPIAEDSKFWFDVMKYGNIGNIDEPLVRYRRSETQISNSNSSEMKSHADRLRSEIYRYILERYAIDPNNPLDTLKKIPDDPDALYTFIKFTALNNFKVDKAAVVRLIIASRLSRGRKIKLSYLAMRSSRQLAHEVV